MRKTLLRTVFIVFGLVFLMSFKTNKPFEVSDFVGSYGNPTMMHLVLNKDFTFHYTNYINSRKSVDVKGKWKLENASIYLTEYPSTKRIIKIWHIDADGNRLKSKRLFTFYTLCKNR